MADSLFFYLFAAVTVGASLLVIGRPNPIHSVLLLILSFGGLTGLYVLLDAPFVAVIQIIIYAGAIMVLFLFVVMLLNAPTEDVPGEVVREARGLRGFGALLAAVLAAQLWWALTRVGRVTQQGGTSDGMADLGSVAEIGRRLYTEHAFAFEVTSVLILTAMLGAVVLARRADIRVAHRDVTTEDGQVPGAAHDAPRPTLDA